MNKPNIILIMTDDQGYGDLSCMGATDFRTPASGRDGAGGHALLLHVFQFSGVLAVARVAADRPLSRKRGAFAPFWPGHRRASGLTPAAPTIASALKPPRIPYRTVRQMASGSEAGIAARTRTASTSSPASSPAASITIPTSSIGEWPTATPIRPTTCGRTIRRSTTTANT